MLGYVAIALVVSYATALLVLVVVANTFGDILFKREVITNEKDRRKNILWAIIAAPIWEEAVFRGPIYFTMTTTGKNSPTTWCALIVTSVIFGVMHLFTYRIVPPAAQLIKGDRINNAGRIFRVCHCAIFGISCGLLVMITGSMISSVLLHSLVNTIGVAMELRANKSASQEEK